MAQSDSDAVYQRAMLRKGKLSAEYHDSQSSSRRSAQSQMQQRKSKSLAAVYPPKATPPSLAAMQATLLPTHKPHPQTANTTLILSLSTPCTRTLKVMHLPSHRARPQVLVYGVPGADPTQAASHNAALRGLSAEDTARRRAFRSALLPGSPTGAAASSAHRLATFQLTNKIHQPRIASMGVERVLRSVRACPNGTPAWDLVDSLTEGATRALKPVGLLGVPAEIIAKAAMAAYRPGPHLGLPAQHLGLRRLHGEPDEERNAVVDDDAWVVF